MTKKARPRPEYEALVQRISTGEITRLEAAQLAVEQTGLSANTFLSWVRSSGVAKKLKHTRGTVGANSIHAHKDPDKVKAYEDALAEAMGSSGSLTAIAAKHGVSYGYLSKKVRAARAALAATVRTPTTSAIHDIERALFIASGGQP